MRIRIILSTNKLIKNQFNGAQHSIIRIYSQITKPLEFLSKRMHFWKFFKSFYETNSAKKY